MKLFRGGTPAMLALVFCLVSVGCNDVVVLNPLSSVADDRIIGSWASEDGKLAYLIRRGEGQAYQSWTADALKKNEAPVVFFPG